MNSCPEVRPSEFRSLGNRYRSYSPLRIESDADGVRLVPTISHVKLALVGVFIGAVTGVLAMAVLQFDVRNLVKMPWVVFPPILAVGIPVAYYHFVYRQLSSVSPLLEYRIADDEVWMHAGTKRFKRDQVNSLIAVALRTGESVDTELQLMVVDGGVMSPHLVVANALFPDAAFERTLNEFSDRIGIRMSVVLG